MSSVRSYDPGELELIKDAWLADPQSDKQTSLFDQTWNDMNMDRVFARIDTCASLAGEERLYAMLREPFSDAEELRRRDELIRLFDNEKDLSREYRGRLEGIGRDIKQPASVTVKKLSEAGQQGNIGHILCALLGVFSICMIFVSPTAGLIIFLITLILNISTYFRRKEQIGEYLSCFSYLIRAYRAARSMLSVRDDPERSYRKKLERAVSVLSGVVRGGFLLTGGRGLTGGLINMLLDYLRIFFHLDLMKFNSMQKKVLEHKDDIEELFIALGEIDAFIAVAEYRRSLPFWCVPELIISGDDSERGIMGNAETESKDNAITENGGIRDSKAGIEVKRLSHPLLDHPVASDIRASGKGVLVTGSNASGKSTFLRSVGLAAILGQSLATVYAESYRASRFYIVSSMTVADDIVSGSSYYMAEIKAVKRLIDACGRGIPVLCFVDELLKGTNTIERIASSSEILKSLVRDNVICFAATHDAELTDMLAGHYDNYHFEEDISDGDVKFSFKLMEGSAKSRNAIRLLEIMGYDESITEAAVKRAEEFEKTGEWGRL
ncbi:MAG: hypothetical protein K6G42_04710 [Lachnospiraceae bacterium]|nr:hypothetical protein [Lachnospiraceae bacterium]